MKAVTISKFGGPEVIEITDRAMPEVKPGQVLIEIKAAGVNPIDMKIRDGSSFAAKQMQFPIILGFDMSGVVTQCGEGVSELSEGDKVFGLVGMGAQIGTYAEYAVVDQAEVIKNDYDIPHEVAGGLSLVALTAWKALVTEGNVKADEKVFIHAGAGGVGHLATQYARALGAEVYCSASGDDIEYLNHLGVKQVVDFRSQNFVDEVNDMDLVIDLVGGETGLKSLDILKPEGRLITVPTYSHKEVLAAAKEKSINAKGILVAMNREELKNIAGMLKKGSVKLRLFKSLSLNQARQAHEMIQAGQAKGKVVLLNE